MKLIINGDDFGMNIDSSLNILKCFEEGVLRSTSVIINNIETHGEIEKLNSSNIDCGIHLNLSYGSAISHKNNISSIINRDKTFLSLGNFSKKYLTGKINLLHIFHEFSNQVEKLKKFGVKVTHIDSHLHIHLFTGIFKVILAISEKYNIPIIRNAFINSSISCKIPLSSRNIIKFLLVTKGKLENYSNYHSKIISPDYTLGFYDISNNSIYNFIEKYKNENIIVELLTHPEETIDGRWNKLLLDSDFKNFLDKHKIELINFKKF